MKKSLLTASLALLLLLPACGKEQPPLPSSPVQPVESQAELPTPTPSPEPAISDTPVPDPDPSPEAAVWGELRYDQTFTADDGAIVMLVTYAFPRLESAEHPAAEAINSYYTSQGEEFLSAAEETAQWGRAEYEIAVQSGFTYMPFVEELSFQMTRETEDYVSISREIYANNGGAHPNTYAFSEQFSLDDGHRLYFADFFSDPDTALSRIISTVESQAQDLGLNAGDATSVFQAEQFYITDEGFVFWLQGGALAAQNSPIEFPVPYDDLSDLVKLW